MGCGDRYLETFREVDREKSGWVQGRLQIRYVEDKKGKTGRKRLNLRDYGSLSRICRTDQKD